MKNITIILGFLYLCCGLGFSTVTAQNADSQFSINVSADIVSSVEIITIRPMNLSDAKPQNNQIHIDPKSSRRAGKMVAVGNPNDKIRISFLENRQLTQQSGSQTVGFQYRVTGNTRDDQATAEKLNAENRDFRLNDEGRFYLWIGGQVDVSTAPPGNYRGDFTLEIEYL
ncbi:protein of unknown function (DUF4402) [Fodinibius salinus]|uniref:DUF4402 domain-containing protein n=1 Tax=Fodinibius salinus TaxID=860790 RepID=A0A5D3YRN6_9BACT|nr:DUF4402 domain-containing protein [Fodinibius salinus]TYP95663.1 protein of unknown function (DUF4402) [Fodinibius salinus]